MRVKMPSYVLTPPSNNENLAGPPSMAPLAWRDRPGSQTSNLLPSEWEVPDFLVPSVQRTLRRADSGKK